MMTKTNEVVLRNGLKANLVTDDTFTLAWEDMTETTPMELALHVTRKSLVKLTSDSDSNVAGKAEQALEMQSSFC